MWQINAIQATPPAKSRALEIVAQLNQHLIFSKNNNYYNITYSWNHSLHMWYSYIVLNYAETHYTVHVFVLQCPTGIGLCTSWESIYLICTLWWKHLRERRGVTGWKRQKKCRHHLRNSRKWDTKPKGNCSVVERKGRRWWDAEICRKCQRKTRKTLRNSTNQPVKFMETI